MKRLRIRKTEPTTEDIMPKSQPKKQLPTDTSKPRKKIVIPPLRIPKLKGKLMISASHWYLIMAVLVFGLVLTSMNTYGVYQQPDTKEESVLSLSYVQTATFDYTATLQNNTVYETTVLRPGQGILFKRILEAIDAELRYSVQSSTPLSIDGSYAIYAQLKTSYWQKQYTLLPTTTFSTSSNTNAFTASFPIDINLYESIVQSINEEIGVNPGNPELIIQSTIMMHTQHSGKQISETFRPKLTIPLHQNTIEITENLTQTQRGMQYKTVQIENEDAGLNKQNWSAATIILFGGTIAFPLVVNRSSTKEDKQTKTLKKFMKKYGEIIIEVQQKPDIIGSKNIAVNSIDDLIKVSEELGKPVLYTQLLDDYNHAFFVVDQSLVYYYLLS
jgi:hypothetical protein